MGRIKSWVTIIKTRTGAAARRGREQALRVSELSYRRLFEAAQDGILLLDVDALSSG
jgi:PAS domain-containing protein